MLSKGQLKLIANAKARLGLSQEDYWEILSLYGGARSFDDLTPEGFFRIMDHFRELGYEVRTGDSSATQRDEARPGKLIEMVTPKQRALIKKLEKRLGWAEDPENIERFILKSLNIRKVRTQAEAARVIKALKFVLAHGGDKNAGAG